MIKIAGIIIVSLVLIIFIKDTEREFSILLSIAVCIMIFMSISDDIVNVAKTIMNITSNNNEINSYINLMVKVLGISLIGQFVIDLCRDSGEGALATQTEIATKIIILTMTLPLFETVINIVTGLLK